MASSEKKRNIRPPDDAESAGFQVRVLEENLTRLRMLVYLACGINALIMIVELLSSGFSAPVFLGRLSVMAIGAAYLAIVRRSDRIPYLLRRFLLVGTLSLGLLSIMLSPGVLAKDSSHIQLGIMINAALAVSIMLYLSWREYLWIIAPGLIALGLLTGLRKAPLDETALPSIYNLIVVIVFATIAAQSRYKTRRDRYHNERELLLQQNELQQVVRELGHRNEVKDRIFTIIAHDLKNPFLSIQMAVNGLLRQAQTGTGDPDPGQTLELVSRTVSDTLMTIDKLAAWGKAQAGSLAIKPRMVEMQPLVASAAHDIPALTAKQCTVTIHTRKPSQMHADPEVLRTVLHNLLSNAAKFSHPNGIIRIRASAVRCGCLVCVHDRGIGIPGQHAKKILSMDNRFFQTGTAGESGSGIGLLICRELVERHFGQIRVKSRPGWGTIVLFTLRSGTMPPEE